MGVTIHKLALIVLISCMLLPREVTSDHVSGSDFHVNCIGDDQYELVFNFYRNCGGVNHSDTISINIYSSCLDTIVDLPRTGIKEVSPKCDNTCSSCDESCMNSFGKESHTYKDTLDLSGYNCCSFDFSLSRAVGRNYQIIDNIEGSGGASYRFNATLNTCYHECPSTPVFVNEPISALCSDRSIISDQSVIDTYGDSLVYELAPQLDEGGNPLTWASGYNTSSPLDYLYKDLLGPNADFPTGFHLDQHTGELKFTPKTNNTFRGYFAIKVKQYRDDSLVSETRRDMEAYIQQCQYDDMPYLDPEPDQQQQICAGNTLNIEVPVLDPQNNYYTMFYWNVNPEIEGASYISDTGFTEATGHFSWTPDTSHIRDKPYKFGYKARVDACPIYSSLSRPLFITVNPPPDISYSADVRNCGSADFQAHITNIDGGHFKWDFVNDTTISAETFTLELDPGIHPYTLTVSGVGCEITYHDTIEVPEYLTVDAGPDALICENDTFLITPVPQHNKGTVTYDVNDFAFQDQVTINASVDTQLIITAKDTAGCLARDTVSMDVRAIPEPDVRDYHFCADEDPGTVTTSLHPDYEIEWRSADDQLFNTGPNFPLPDTGRYVLSAADQDLPGCNNSDTFSVYQDKPAEELGDTVLCEGQTLEKSAAVSANSYQWYHQEEGQEIGNDSLLVYEAGVPGNIELTVGKNFGPRTCIYQQTFNLEVKPRPDSDLNIPSARCLNDQTVELEMHDSLETSWSGPGIVDDVWKPAEAGTGTHTIAYTISGELEDCTSADSAETVVHALPELYITADPDSGDAPLTVNLSGSIAEDGTDPAWIITSESGGSDTLYQDVWDFDHVFDSSAVYIIMFSAEDATTGCRDTLEKQIHTTDGDPNLIRTHDVKGLSIYPNPANTAVNIEAENYDLKRILLTSTDGSKLLDKNPASSTYKLQRKNLEAGIYILQLELSNGSIFKSRIIFE